MNTYLKYKPVWVQLITFGALTCAFYIVLGGISTFVIASSFNISLPELINPETANAIAAAKMAQCVVTIWLFGVTALVFGYLSSPRPLKYLGFKRMYPRYFWAVALLLFLGALPAVNWLAQINQQFHFPKSLAALENSLRAADMKQDNFVKKLLTANSTYGLLTNILIVALLPAFLEELFFRGVLQRLFIQICKKPLWGILITAIIFSAIHFQFTGFLPRVLLGVLLGVLYWYSGSLWPGIVAHFLNNAAQVYLFYRYPAIVDKEIHLSIWLVMASSVFIVAMIVYMRKISNTRYSEVYETEKEIEEP